MTIRKAGAGKPTDEPTVTSPLYEEIVADFLARAEADAAVPSHVVRNLRQLFKQGPPKKDALTAAFQADEDGK